MNEASLLAFQMEEIIDSARYVLFGLCTLAMVGVFAYVTYHFMGDDE